MGTKSSLRREMATHKFPTCLFIVAGEMKEYSTEEVVQTLDSHL